MSFSDSGMLAELAKSKRYVLPYKEQERLLKEAKEAGLKRGLEQGEKKLKAEILKSEKARVLKANGVKAELIAEATGLSLAEVKKLKG